MKKFYWIFLSLLIVVTACKKNSDDNNNTGWTEEDQTFYNNVITLQDKASENYTTWSQTMDSLEVINKLQQFFLSDPSVTSATIGSQGIAVQYSNGMRGGIFLNPENSLGEDSLIMGPIPKIPNVPLNGKSLVNKKKMIFLSPAYWELSTYSNMMLSTFRIYLPKSGFDLTVYEDANAAVDRFTQLADYGIIYFDSHGWAWPDKKNIEEVYLLTGEEANDLTTKKYGDDLKKGDIPIIIIDPESRKKNVYWLSSKFITSHNDFSKDTVLFVGGFCYSFLGGWDQIYTKFAKGAYFGFDWGVKYWRCAQWSMSLIDSLCDTIRKPPFNPERWMTGTAIAKSYYYDKENRTVHIEYVGDATLTLWKDSAKVVTNPITNITQTTATGGGNIKSDGGFPVTARGVCWSTSSNPTTSDSYTTDGSGTGAFASNITGLTMNTPYYVRAYATNSKGTIYGNQVSFTTLSNAFYLGQIYGGGIIFYIDGTGQHGLIVAHTNSYASNLYARWGCDTILVGTSTAIGTGQANTTAILNKCNDEGIAARVCDQYSVTVDGVTYDDWFLPSKDELNQIYLQRLYINYLNQEFYWSSSELNVPNVWTQKLDYGGQTWNSKAYPNYFRAIRAF